MDSNTFLNGIHGIHGIPRLYHLAWGGAWPSIQEKGLMSTETLLDAYHVVGEQRIAILEEHRPNPVPLGQGVVVRDNNPLGADDNMMNYLNENVTPQAYRGQLNGHVFLWPNLQRLNGMLGAYLGQPQTLIVIDARRLLLEHNYWAHVKLSRINTGAMIHNNNLERGLDVFSETLPFPNVPNEVAEVVFPGIIPADVLNASIVEVYSIENGQFTGRLYPVGPTPNWGYGMTNREVHRNN